MGPRVEYVKVSGNGPNALDFHIAFYIGQLAAQDPDAYFHIISKDTGFDPLIQHLKSKDVLACRSPDVTAMPIVKVANSKTLPERAAVIIADLQQRSASKPRTVKTLSNTINALFQKTLSEEELSSLVHELQKLGIVTVKDTAVSYNLPA